ncbi:hypothetical protein ACFTQ7_24220 [Lysinibacillus sp. NPDC056959]|uniref:hypothetical protein n=1 Tax=Lysinibacillus sp. NPDC056959 TaxID=3345981 RepID=UPI00362CE4F6
MIKSGKKANSKALTVILMLLVIMFFVVPSSNAFFVNKMMIDDNNSERIKVTASNLVIPTRDSIISDGYPINEDGQTYGPNMENLMLVEPELMLAEGENGELGYIYQPDGISSPNKVDEYNKSFKKSTPLYLHDGKTIIGTFYFY